jgi:hypothetical membrane protein
VSRRLALAEVLRHPLSSAQSRESAAMLVAGASFVVVTGIALLAFWGRTLTISGPGSIGEFVAVGAAVTAILVFVAARRLNHARPPSDRLLPRMRWFDVASVALAHGVIALLGWVGTADIFSRSFRGALVFPLSGALLAGVAIALTAYIVLLSAVSMTPTLLSLVLMVFLVVGVFASMLSATDDQWWKKNLSSLGITDDISALAFNLTLIIAGLVVTTVAHFGTAGLPATTARGARGRRIVRIELMLLGILLACVGLFPVDRFLTVHNVAASGMAVLFVVMVIRLRRDVPDAPRVFVMLGHVFVACIVVLAVLFATGYYNLTAVELVAFVMIFAWLLLFLRNVGAAADAETQDVVDTAAAEPRPSAV